jgi:hypothetical protein
MSVLSQGRVNEGRAGAMCIVPIGFHYYGGEFMMGSSVWN